MKHVTLALMLFLSLSVANGQTFPSMDECCHTFDSANIVKNNPGWSYWFMQRDGLADTLSVKISHVYNVLTSHPPHAHNEDETFYILQGPALLHLNGEERVLQTGDHFYAPGGSNHNIARVGEGPITYLMFKRETKGKLDKPFLPLKENYTMDDCVVYLREENFKKSGNGKALWYLDKAFSGGLNVKRSVVEHSSALHGAHKHAEQEVYFVLSGKALITMNGESKEVGAMTSFYCPPHSEHGIARVGSEPLHYLVVKTE